MAEILRDIKRRIKSVKNIQQITKAMEMVAAARLKRTEVSLRSIKYFTNNLEDCLKVVLTPHQFAIYNLQSAILIIFSADRGLCGAYNNNIIKATENFLNKYEFEKIYCIGKKIYYYLLKTNYKDRIIQIFLSQKPTYQEFNNLFNNILKEQNKVSIYVIFTEFISTTKHKVKIEKILPIDVKLEERNEMFIFEPQKEEIAKLTIKKYIIAKLYECYLNAKSSEESSRMLAMQQANKNAMDMIDNLTLLFNKARQAAITKEILEVVSGAEALK